MGDYPSEATLKLIAEWDIVKQGIVPLVHLVKDIWHWEDYCILKGNSLQLHCGGWSGNEDIICALERNWIFWSVCWKKSTCGGHHWFEVKELKKVDDLAAKGGETSVSKKVSHIVHLSKNKPLRKSRNEDRMREGIKCTECGRWTTCWSDISIEAKKFYLCLACLKKVKGEKE